jgi:hypothetical protein
LERPDKETVENFVIAFQTEGFELCKGSGFEAGFEKIALYLKANVPKHAARSLPDGGWTSKMGDDEDIEHTTLGVLEGRQFGKATVFLRRKNPLFTEPKSFKLRESSSR